MEAERNTLIVSDFHMSEGFHPESGKWSAHEDFTYERPFLDFLRYYTSDQASRKITPWLLLIGGDLFDFLQVVSVPAANPSELRTKLDRLRDGAAESSWSVAHPISRVEIMCKRLESLNNAMLQDLIDEMVEYGSTVPEAQVWRFETLAWELLILASYEQAVLPEKYKRVGLGTTWEQTCWKLDRIAEGHSLFFTALAEFLDRGNDLTLVKGNHDLELHWPQVGERFKQLIVDARLHAGHSGVGLEAVSTLSEDEFDAWVDEHVIIKPWVVYEDGLFYFEHGSQYESLNAVANFLRPVLYEDPRYTQLPPGSFLVRYYSNEIEKYYPFVDSVKPSSKFVRWVLRTDFFNFVWIFIRNTRNHLRYFGKVAASIWRDFRSRRKGDRHNLKTATTEETFQKLSPRDQESHRALYEMEYRGLRESIQGPLGVDQLEAIMVAAEQIRGNFIGRLFRYALYVLFFLGIMIALTIAFFGFVSGVITLISGMGQNPIVRFLISQILVVIGLITATAMYKLATNIVAGGDYLNKAAQRVHTMFESSDEEARKPSARYYVFGHSHEPDVRRIDLDSWYVNTGSWLPVESEVDRWDRRQADFTYLLIEQGEQKGPPALLRWNPEAARPERIRLRMVPE